MELSVSQVAGIPNGSLLSVRAGSIRRQGPLTANKPMRFPISPAEACPFTVDILAPVASGRLTLKPSGGLYKVPFGERRDVEASQGQIELHLTVSEVSTDKAQNPPSRTQSRQEQRQKSVVEAQQYIDKHQIAQFVQNLMQSLLRERPDDPWAYLSKHLHAVQAESAPPKVAPKPAAADSHADPRQYLRLRPKNFDGPAFVVQNSAGQVTVHRPLDTADLVPSGIQARRLRVRHLGESFHTRNVATPLDDVRAQFQDASSWVSQSCRLPAGSRRENLFHMLRAGPRKLLHFEPRDVTAAIVTCGGLCPGLNAVIRELVIMLYLYGAKKIWGIRGGYKGVTDTVNWVELTPKTVQQIHSQGGTVLVSDRGNPPIEEQAQALKSMGVRQYFVVGGDGTHRGAYETYETMQSMGWECSVVGVPKTIDNDVPMLDRTFGFDTACTEAGKAIAAAYVEATCNANCIGLVKLMGRHCGYIAMNACLAARNVDICLLPEMDISIHKVLNHCLHVMQTKGHAVIVVAEGCGDTLLESSGERDAGGNAKLADVGTWLKDKILARFKEVKLPLTIKYIDPTYMIRAVKPNADDSVYCSVLAQNAVHAAMAGYTGVTIGRVLMRYVMLPIQAITQQRSRRVDVSGRWFARLVETTLQPDLAPDGPPKAVPATPAGLQEPLECTEVVEALSVLRQGDEVRRLELEHLSEKFVKRDVPTTLSETVQGASIGFVDQQGAWVTQTLGNESEGGDDREGGGSVKLQMVQAGPRRSLHFRPEAVVAAIVTCGGLCPGLNSVIRELVMLLYAYGVRKVYGIKGGYKGVVLPKQWLTLTPDNVKNIHLQGGSVLVADRGNPSHDEMGEVLRSKGVSQFFVLGGDGTHRGAYTIYQAMTELRWECAVVGIPKTIDNDIAIVDRTFGFNTAVDEALKSIDTAYVEATCNANCIGLVKLMGRHCGYLAMMSVLAARHVDMCLLPEMDISLEKVLEHSVYLLNNQGYAVVVVAEGCGETLLQSSGNTDAGGNKKLADVGPWLKDKIMEHFKALKKPLTIKYVDPTYSVRAIPANPNDSIYCSVLAQNAVHAAMAGYTGVTVAKVDEAFVYLPIAAITQTPNKQVDVKGRWFERLQHSTQQPHFGSCGTANAKPINPEGPSFMQRQRSLQRLSITSQGPAEEVTVPETKITIIDGYGSPVESRKLQREDLVQEGVEIRKLQCFRLGERFGESSHPTTLLKNRELKIVCADSHSWTTQAMYYGKDLDTCSVGEPYYQMVRAGPRDILHFDPHDPHACAAVVSCGGICPGLNCVIREVVMTLWSYGVRRIYGIKGGFKGVTEPDKWITLTPEVVQDIHTLGGTILVSDRGNPPSEEMAKAVKSRNVRQLFVLGGDGTHRGAMDCFSSCLDLEHECAVVGVPKTIDNDVPILDQTFGFDTACTEAVRAVDSAYVEATCNANSIGLVKLMGRHCGFIAMYAALSARHVDICLLPEMTIDIEKVLQHAVQLMKTKRHAVVVVAEGCGDTLIKSSGETDAGGNKKLADVGLWLKATITQRFKELGLPLTIKYIDPTYMIRAVPANAFDSTYCSVLGQNAVHASMAGYSGITVGKVSEQYVYLPIHAITMQSGRRVNPDGRWFARLLETTQQPDFTPDGTPRAGEEEQKGRGRHVMHSLSSPASINDLLQPGDTVQRFGVVSLGERFQAARLPNTSTGSHAGNKDVLVGDQSWATTTLRCLNKRDEQPHLYTQMLLSGPRELMHFAPERSNAVVVTCGGICPGLNSVIREITMSLLSYGVQRVFGCKGGYKGMVQRDSWVELTPDVVKNIHMQGGTILVSDRGNPPHLDIAKTLQREKITQCFVLGGDGTHRGAMEMFESMQSIGHECAVVGVPKTIDNDIPILDRSFGFKTACTEAERVIDAAYMTATSNVNCIGLVKLMGRHCGFIAMEATLAARHVDICLLPEMNLSLPKLLTHAVHLIRTKGNAVIVVAEGCGDTLIKGTGETDAGGNRKLADVGMWLQEQLIEHFLKMQVPITLKYFDPTYMIRAVPANANDSVLCSVLGQHAVHGAMAGYSGITVGKVDERYVMLPIHAITTTPPRRVDLMGPDFGRLMATTGQPNLQVGVGDEWALMPPYPDKPMLSRMGSEAALPSRELSLLEWKRLQALPQDPTSGEEGGLGAVQLRVLDGFGEVKEERPLKRDDLLSAQDEVRRLAVMQLSDRFGVKRVESPLKGRFSAPFLDEESWATEALSTSERVDSGKGRPYYQVLRAGPREYLHFDPKDANGCAAIVSCGGMCPGENACIRELVMTLYRYGVSRVYGIRGGFKGVLDGKCWLDLNKEAVENIHEQGGTILTCQRGNPPHPKIAAALKEKGVRQFFAIGGEGAHRGLLQLLTALADLNHECACVAVPATIDNDIPLMDVAFGFDTACTVARGAIDAAYVEATCNANCIGFVKLTGHRSGFLALHTTLASRHVDLCLLPEMEIDVSKVLRHCERLMETKGYGVVVVADGAGGSIFRSAGGEPPESGDVGPFLRDRILSHFKQKGKPLTIKYIDPTYMVRSASASAVDSVFCSHLAEHAVHAAMAGYTGVTAAKLYERHLYLPIQAIVQLPFKTVNLHGRWYARLLFTTQQPDFEPDGFCYPPVESQGLGLEAMSTATAISKLLPPGTRVDRLECANLGQTFTSKEVPSPIGQTALSRSGSKAFVPPSCWSMQTFKRANSADTTPRTYLQMLRSGARRVLHFDPKEPGAAAAIVTCGGLCPGLNSVIREVVKMLQTYGVSTVWGIKGGYKGCVEEDQWLSLTEDVVQDIHTQGGSILVSDRGNPPHSEIAKVLQRRRIRWYFVLGGDGTHAGAMETFKEMTKLGHECAVVGVPKTIDNDIVHIDRSFGYDTACTEAKRAIDSAYVESTTNANCIGLVKLMGRHCGWIALQATLAARYVDVCLIPEMDISLPKLLAYLAELMRTRQRAVIVVAEGCGDTIIASSGEKDGGGNKKLADVGIYLKDQITSHCKGQGIPLTIKYIDPTYMVRSVPPTAKDSEYCGTLAQQAVHAAMAGYTGITCAKVDERFVMLPIAAITGKGQRKVELHSRHYERLMVATMQPSFAP